MTYPNNYFSLNVFLLKIGGMWMSDKTNNSCEKLLLYYNYFCILTCQIFYIPSEMFMLTETYQNLNTFIEHLGMIITHALGTFKVLNWFLKHEKIKKIMRVLESDEFKYKSETNFRPGLIFQRAKKVARIFNIVFACFVVSVPLSLYIVATMNYVFNTSYKNFGPRNITCNNILPYFSWIPFRTGRSNYCGIDLLFQSIPLHICGLQILAHDALFTSIAIYIRAHLLTLQESFKSIRRRCLNKFGFTTNENNLSLQDEKILQNDMQAELRKCTLHLQTIIELCNEVENNFTFITLGQTLVTLFGAVSCLFIMSLQPPFNGVFIGELIYFVGIIFQLSLYCWFGNEITLASTKLTQSIFENDWLQANMPFKKEMLFNMIRLNKPIFLTIGKFTPLTLGSLVNIVRGSYSYYAVLKQTQTT